MKPVGIEWLDLEGHAFILKTQGMWPFEVKDLAAAFLAEGYANMGGPDQFVIIDPETASGGPARIKAAIIANGYLAEAPDE